jgi:hypothetical protein
MTLTHNECGGKVLLDLMYKGETFIDLSCMTCGKRWHIPKNNALASLIMGYGKN